MMQLDQWGLILAVCLLVGLCVLLLVRYEYLRGLHNELLREKEVVFSFVHDIGDVFSEDDTHELNSLLKRVLFYALRTSKGGAGAIYLVEPGRRSLRAVATSGTFVPLADTVEERQLQRGGGRFDFVESLVRNRVVGIGEGVIGEVVSSDQAVLIEDGELDPRIPRHQGDFLQIQSVLAVPMRFHREVLGVLVVMNRVDGMAFTYSDQNLLQAVADQASVSVHFTQQSQALDEKRRLDQDLGFAHRIQAALLPSELPSHAGIEFGAFSVPAKAIGGDYYDIVQVDDTHIGLAIADVSGKGVSGALMMAACRSVLRLSAVGCLSCGRVMRELNSFISADLNEDMFISMLYMILNTETYELSVARAGHLQPLIFSGKDEGVRRVESSGIAMGMADTETFNEALEEAHVKLEPEDLVVIYTDGVPDAQSQAGEEWGEAHFRTTLKALNIDGLSADEIAGSVHQRLFDHIGETPQYDDMTLVAMRVR